LQECVVPPTQTLHTHSKIGSNHDSERFRKVYSFIRSDLDDFSQRWSSDLALQFQKVMIRQEELFRVNLCRYEELLQGSMSRQEKLLQCFAEERASIVHVSEDRAKLGASLDMTSQTLSSACAKRVEKQVREPTKFCIDTFHLEAADKARAPQAEPEATEAEPEPASPSSFGSRKDDFMDVPTTMSDFKPTRKTGDSVAELIKMEIVSRRRAVMISKASHDSDSALLSEVSLPERVMRALRSDRFEWLSCIVTFLNFIFYGIEVQIMATQHNPDKHWALTTMMVLFSVYFGCELALRIAANRWDFLSGQDKWWNFVDSIVVLASLTEIFMDLLQTEQKRIFRFAQIFRMLRIFRIIRAFRFLQDLKTLITSILSTMQQLFWTIALIFMLLYMFAIIFTEASTASGLQMLAEQGAWPCNEDSINQESCMMQNLYGDLFTSMLTLYMSITGGMDWSDAYHPLGPVFAILFLVFVTFTILAVMNVVTAIFCQSAIDGAANQREVQMQKFEEQQEMYSRQLGDVFKVIDVDGSGDLTMDEFEIGVMNPRVQTFFESMELSIQEARLLFNLLRSGEDTAIDIDDFIEGCLQLRGSARNFDVALLRYECRHLSNKVNEFLETSRELQSSCPTTDFASKALEGLIHYF